MKIVAYYKYIDNSLDAYSLTLMIMQLLVILWIIIVVVRIKKNNCSIL